MFKNLSAITNSEIILHEKINIDNAQKILHHDDLDLQTIKSLEKYIKLYQKNNHLKVSYKDNSLGRLKIKAVDIKEDETLLTTPFMWNIVKSALCKGIYNDLDIKNCCGCLLEQLCEFNNIKCKVLKYYNRHRPEIIKKAKMNKDEYKKQLYKMMFNRVEQIYDDEFLEEFNIELKEITKELLKIYPNFINHNLKFNKEGQALSMIYFQMEKLVLLKIFEYLKGNGYNVGALLFDGLHVEGKPNLKDIQKFILDNLEVNIELEYKSFKDVELDTTQFFKNEIEASLFIVEKLKNILVRCNAELYIKDNNIWTFDNKKINYIIKTYIVKYNLLVKNNLTFINMSKSLRGINTLLELVKDSDRIPIDDNFDNTLWYNNLGSICFNNGFYNFNDKKFYKYENNNIYSTIKINYDFEERNEEDIKEFYKLIIDPIFSDKEEMKHIFLNYISRSIAGCYTDKDWLVGLGERDSGTGVIIECCMNTFEDYIKETNAENFVFKDNISDVAKSYSWLVKCRYKRLLYSSEFMKKKKGGEVNGNLIKKITSGGDTIEARTNNKDEQSFKLQCKYMALLNDIPEITPSDAKDTLTQFNFPCKFVNKDDKRLKEKNLLYSYQIANHNIKNIIKEPKFRMAFFYIIKDYFDRGKPIITNNEILNEMNEMKEDDNDELKFLELFEFTGNKNDYISINQIKCIVIQNNLNLSSIKYTRIIKSKIGDTKTSRQINKKSVMIRTGIKAIEQDDNPNDCNNDLDI